MSLPCRVIKGGYCEGTQGYKPNKHYGIDIVNKNYTLGYIIAHSDGVVVKARNNCNATYKTNAEAIKVWGDGFGNYVMIDHQNGFFTQYEHLQYNSLTVKVGDKVKKGQVIGYMGNTGHSNGGHLHFQVNKSLLWSDVIDPTPYLDSDFVVQPAEKDINQNQLYVNVSQLRIRESYDTTSKIIGLAEEDKYYNYYDVKENGGYTWYKLAENQWIANSGEWLTIYPKTSIEELEKQIEKLHTETLELKATINELEKLNVEANEKIVTLTKQLNQSEKEKQEIIKQLENATSEYEELFHIGKLYICTKN